MIVENKHGIRSVVSNEMGQSLLKKGFKEVTFFSKGNSQSNKVLVLREVGGLGDIICILPLVEYLYNLGYSIDLFCPPHYNVIFKGYVETFIDSVKVQNLNYDLNKYRYVFQMFCPAADHEGRTDFRVTESRIDSFSNVFEGQTGIAKKPVFKWIKPQSRTGDYIVVSLKTKNPSKNYSLNNWTKLFRMLPADIPIYVVDDQVEINFSQENVLSKKFRSVEKLIRFVRSARFVITLDTGIMHIAGALNVNTIALFGPTSEVLAKYYDTCHCIRQEVKEDCYQPCFYNVKNNRYHCFKEIGKCMLAIKPETVYNKIKELGWIY